MKKLMLFVFLLALIPSTVYALVLVPAESAGYDGHNVIVSGYTCDPRGVVASQVVTGANIKITVSAASGISCNDFSELIPVPYSVSVAESNSYAVGSIHNVYVNGVFFFSYKIPRLPYPTSK